MPALEKITISPGLAFDALVAGELGAPLVLLLHGFAESMHCWRAQVAAVAAAGYRAVAPSQRGYSPGARPDMGDTANYHIDRLMDDAMAIVAASGDSERRFHLVGHDWGGSIAWALGDRFPQRLASLTILSRPHPNAFNRALQMPDGEQAQRSRHHKAFLEPGAADVVLADDARWLRERWTAAGVPADAIEKTSCRARQQERDGGSARMVSRAWRDPRPARPDPGANALHLGRCRRHRRADRRRGHGGFHRRTLSL
jgi:pimeloyl-ACP methyl ester carboxylesterase